MLIDGLAMLFIGILNGVLGLVPSFSLPGGFGDAGAGIGSALGAVNQWVPVSTIMLCIAAVLACRVFLVVWSLVVFIYDRVPLKAT